MDTEIVIPVVVNGKVTSALVDTGSYHSIITEEKAKEFGQINTTRRQPALQGVTGSPLRLLGSIQLNIEVGTEGTVKHWVSVVPKSYLTTDMLLGCDILKRSAFLWDVENRTLVWGKRPYPIRVVKRKRKIRQIAEVPAPVKSSPPVNNLHATQKLILGPNQSKFVFLPVKEEVGATLVVHPHGNTNVTSHPFCVTVNSEKKIPYPLCNNTKAPKIFKAGTWFGHWERGEISSLSVRTIQNDLIPHFQASTAPGNRKEKLKDLLSQQPTRNLTKEHRKGLEKTLLEHDKVFLLEEGEIGTFQTPPAHIEVVNPIPSRAPIYRYPETAKGVISDMLEDMEARGVIEPSTAAWLSPIVLVNKPDGTKRMCLDYRKVNQHLATDIYPLPRLSELVEQASGHKFYTTLDLKEAYFQVMLHENSRDVTTFSDGTSLYRFRRLPFGLSCSPAIFSRQMASILAPLLKEGRIRNYLDDVILWAPDFPTMLQRIEHTLQVFQKNGVKLNLSKCKFGEAEVKFLGHVVSKEGNKPDPKNVEAIQKVRPPKTVKEVRRFLGMASFYRKHIKDFAEIALPLNKLTRKNQPFEWSEDCQRSLDTLKDLLTRAPVLVGADISQPFIVTTDASNSHVGGVLSQIQPDGSNQPIGYFSKKLIPTETKYSATDKEALGVVLTCRNFHHYLWGSKFTILTDHQPLTSIFKRKTKSPRMNRWILEMREYSYEIKYLKGKHNVVADNLSRPIRIVRTNPAKSDYLGLTPQEVIQAQRKDPRWKELAEYLEGGKLPTKLYSKILLEQFEVQEEILYYVREKLDGSIHYCLVVPHELKGQALNFAHTSAGHLGQKKTIAKTEEYFYWENLKTDVCRYVKNCIICQRFKGTVGLQQKWQETPPAQKPLERVGIDLTDMVAGNQGYRYALTILDHYSRYVKFIPLKNKTSQTVVTALESYVADFGPPQSLVSDNGGEFLSTPYQTFLARHHITAHYTTPYNPRRNSTTERIHRPLKTILASLCAGYPLRWPQYLAACQTALNGAVHLTTGAQPFFAFFGRHAPRRIGAPLPSVDGGAEGMDVAHEVIMQSHLTLTRRSRETANRWRKNQAVSVGTLVWVRRETALPGTCRKLNPKWDGPYRVVSVFRDGGGYLLENVHSGQKLQRAAEKVKPCEGQEEWLVSPPEVPSVEEEENEPPPPRTRRPPRRLIEEC